MSTMILSLEVRDIRFPTSSSLDGSDAMHQSPDYSAPTSCCAPMRQTSSRGTV